MADEKERMRGKATQFFEEADTDGSGGMCKMELAKITKKLGFKKDVDEIVSWFDDLDRNNDDKISLEEFLTEVVDKKDPKEVQAAELRAVFNEMDPNGDGNVSACELSRYISDEFKYDIDPDKLKEMIDSADTTGDGTINYDEFLDAWEQQ